MTKHEKRRAVEAFAKYVREDPCGAYREWELMLAPPYSRAIAEKWGLGAIPLSCRYHDLCVMMVKRNPWDWDFVPVGMRLGASTREEYLAMCEAAQDETDEPRYVAVDSFDIDPEKIDWSSVRILFDSPKSDGDEENAPKS